MLESDAEIGLGSGDNAQPAGDRQLMQCDATGVRRALSACLAWLEQHAEAINALNVFPVPDGDTGTNMVLTLRGAVAEAQSVGGHSAGEVLKAAAHGALMGARGNSGVILSQLLRGVSQPLAEALLIAPKLLADAFASARDTAYQGVMRPVEGTILTVAKEVAAATTRAARNESVDFRQLLAVATDSARHAVAATPTQLQVLADAGVVDAGGQGLFVILEGLYRYANGMGVEYNGHLHGSVDLAAFGPQQEEYGYDTQFIIHGRSLDVDQIREALSSLGDSLLVVGDGTAVKVHIHTDRPGDPLNYGITLGSVRDVVIENMQEQYQTFIATRAAERAAATAKKVGIVAVAQGEGFRRVLESLGADVIVEGGQTMNPSVEELLAAATSLPGEAAILLPNNSNIIMAAQHVQAMADKRIAVVPTRTLPEGISALLAYNYELGVDQNLEAMAAASRQTQTIELTRATRSAVVNGLKIKEGQFIAIVNTELAAADGNLPRTAAKALKVLGEAEYEIATVYRGRDADDQMVEALLAAISRRFPDLEVEMVDGGQPHYYFIVALE
ncbi:MAG: DAK2 domain-containing protein [Anaerolineae bacterium]